MITQYTQASQTESTDIPQQETYTPAPDAAAPPPQQSQGIEPSEDPSIIKDILLAPFRGVEDFARNTYGFARYLTGNALPEYHSGEGNYLGKSETTAGGIVEGVADFLTGFIPFAGVAGKIGGAIGLTSKIATGLAAGAASDFLGQSGHEDRLSNLIQEHPALANPINAYLAADPNDTEIEGRLKTAVEGLGLGVLTEGLISVVKNLKFVRQYNAGMAAEGAEKVAKEAEKKAAIDAQASLDRLAAESHTISGTAPVEVLGEAPPTHVTVPTAQWEEASKLLADKARMLANGEKSSYEGGELFQSPEKSLSRNLNTEEDVKTLLDYSARLLREKMGPTPKESLTETFDKSNAYFADLSGMDPGAVKSYFQHGTAQLEEAKSKSIVASQFVLSLGEELNTALKDLKAVTSGRAIGGDKRTPEQIMMGVLKTQSLLSSTMASAKGFGTVAARLLRSRQAMMKASLESSNAARDIIEHLGGSEFVSGEMKKMMTVFEENAANPAGAIKGVNAINEATNSLGDRLLRAHNELWINSILSGTKTSFADVLGNTFTTMYQPLETAIGSAMQLNPNGVRAALKNYRYLLDSVSDSWRMASRSFSENEARLLHNPSASVVEDARGPYVNAGKFGGPETTGVIGETKALTSGDGNLLSHGFNLFGEIARMPQRMLMTSEEMFKQLNYRAAAKTNLFYRGLDQGLEGDALHAFVADNFQRTVTEGGRKYTEGAVIRDAIDAAEKKGLTGKDYNDFVAAYRKANWKPHASALDDAFKASEYAQNIAEESTFSAPLGKMGKAVQDFAKAHPAFQLVLPFVRTPMNVVKYFGQRGLSIEVAMPGIENLQARNLAEIASADPLIRSRAMGRVGAGNLLMFGAGMAAVGGKITGAGPKDPAELQALKNTGWQPYSMKFNTAEGPMYVSYQRLDPFAPFAGLMADWHESAKRMDPHMASEHERLLSSLATALTNNVTKKTYLASLSQFLDLVEDPEKRFVTWSRARLSGYIPSFVAQFRGVSDDADTMHEVRSYWDAVQNRIPGMQGGLDPKRNVLGEPIEAALAQTPAAWVNPLTLSKDKGDKVLAELAKFGHGIQPPSPALNGVIDLVHDHKNSTTGQSAYDRLQEITGKIKLGGKDLRGALERLIGSSAYQRMAETPSGDLFNSPRFQAVQSVIRDYREAATNQLQHEFPRIKQEMRANMQDQLALRRGQQATQLKALLQQDKQNN